MQDPRLLGRRRYMALPGHPAEVDMHSPIPRADGDMHSHIRAQVEVVEGFRLLLIAPCGPHASLHPAVAAGCVVCLRVWCGGGDGWGACVVWRG